MNDALIAAFLAKGGKISKVETGKTTYGMTNAEWRRQCQMTKADRMALEESADDAEMASIIKHEQVREAQLMGGRAAAMEALNA